MAVNFKSESEVKEYLHNLGIEYRFGCYSEKNPEVCHLLGDYLDAIKKDFEKAGKVYKTNCDEHDYARSCYRFGNFLLVGRGQNKADFKGAYKYFEKGCKLNDANSCYHQGLMMVNNKKTGLERNIRQGMEVLEKSCLGNQESACNYLAGMYIKGVKREEPNGTGTGNIATKSKSGVDEEFEVEKDMSKAYKYTYYGCSLGNMHSCANLSQMYLRGEGIEKNIELAEKYRKIALDIQEQHVNPKYSITFQQGLK